jgi:hypothetical protein
MLIDIRGECSLYSAKLSQEPKSETKYIDGHISCIELCTKWGQLVENWIVGYRKK